MSELPNAASVGIVKHGKILLIKRAFAPYQNLWTFPGGRMEPDETVEHCAVREVQEELSLTIRNPRHVMTQSLGRDGSYRLAVYTTTDYAGQIVPSSEVSDHKWVDPGMLIALRTTSRLDDVIRECFRVLGQSW